jgi:hypothetical protein
MQGPSRVLDRQTQLHEDGRIRIGHKIAGTTREGKEYTRPAMLDKFRLTTSNRLMLEHAATIFGGTVQPWSEKPGEYELYTERTELRVAVSAIHSLSQSYELWSGGGCVRRCDGEMCHFVKTSGKGKDQKIVEEGDAPCMCDRDVREAGTDPKGTCKFKTRLSVMLTELPALGRWRLETSGKMAGDEIPEILSMMEHLGFSSGPVFCVLTLTQKEISKVGQAAKNFVVPVLSLDPNPPSMAALIQRVQQSAFAPLPEAAAVKSIGTSSTPQLGSKTDAQIWAALRISPADNAKLKAASKATGKTFVEVCRMAYERGLVGFASLIAFTEELSDSEASATKSDSIEGWLSGLGLTEADMADFRIYVDQKERTLADALLIARSGGATDKGSLYDSLEKAWAPITAEFTEKEDPFKDPVGKPKQEALI